MKKHIVLIGLVLGFWLLVFHRSVQSVSAETSDATQKVTFMIYPELPKENLGGRKLGYFNLRLKPNTEKTVKIKVMNPTDKTITVKTNVRDAQTADNGRIDYLSAKPIPKHILPQPGSQFLTVKPQLTVKPGTEKWLTIKIKMPKNSFKGKKAMAINLSAMGPTGGSINNRYVYAVGVTLNGINVTKKHLKRLEMPIMKAGFVHKKAALQFKMVNPDPAFLKKGQLSIKLTNQKIGFFNYQLVQKKMHIAPNSKFDVNLMLGGQRLVPGKYTMVAKFKSDQYQKQIKKSVKITKTDAEYINERNLDYQRRRKVVFLFGGICILLIIGTIYYVKVYRARSKQNDE